MKEGKIMMLGIIIGLVLAYSILCLVSWGLLAILAAMGVITSYSLATVCLTAAGLMLLKLLF